MAQVPNTTLRGARTVPMIPWISNAWEPHGSGGEADIARSRSFRLAFAVAAMAGSELTPFSSSRRADSGPPTAL